MSNNDLSFRSDIDWPESLASEQLMSRICGMWRQDVALQLTATAALR